VDPNADEIIYAAFADRSNGIDIRFGRSINSGDTWQLVTVNDDVGLADQFSPAIALDSAGKVNITFYDTRMSSTFEAADVFLARPFTGNSFENLRITTVASNNSKKNLFRDFTANLGDRTSIAMTPGDAVMVWTDTRLGTEDIFLSVVRNPPIVGTVAPSTPSNLMAIASSGYSIVVTANTPLINPTPPPAPAPGGGGEGGGVPALAPRPTPEPTVTFAIPDGGGQSWVTTRASESLSIGSAPIQQNTGNSTLSGLAILGYRSAGVLVTEAAVPASTPISTGRIYVDVNGPVNTGIACYR